MLQCLKYNNYVSMITLVRRSSQKLQGIKWIGISTLVSIKISSSFDKGKISCIFIEKIAILYNLAMEA